MKELEWGGYRVGWRVGSYEFKVGRVKRRCRRDRKWRRSGQLVRRVQSCRGKLRVISMVVVSKQEIGFWLRGGEQIENSRILRVGFWRVLGRIGFYLRRVRRSLGVGGNIGEGGGLEFEIIQEGRVVVCNLLSGFWDEERFCRRGFMKGDFMRVFLGMVGSRVWYGWFRRGMERIGSQECQGGVCSDLGQRNRSWGLGSGLCEDGDVVFVCIR